jgi:methionyl aminopeptidase
VRKFAQSMIKPGIRLIDLCEQLENKNRELVEEAGFAVRLHTCIALDIIVLY